MEAEQNHACAICKAVVSLCVDHEHTSSKRASERTKQDKRCSPDKVRGLLCSNCNNGLGHFSESPEHLASAIEYILKFQVRKQYGALLDHLPIHTLWDGKSQSRQRPTRNAAPA